MIMEDYYKKRYMESLEDIESLVEQLDTANNKLVIRDVDKLDVRELTTSADLEESFNRVEELEGEVYRLNGNVNTLKCVNKELSEKIDDYEKEGIDKKIIQPKCNWEGECPFSRRTVGEVYVCVRAELNCPHGGIE